MLGNMLAKLKLCNFGTFYLWIYVLKVLTVLPLSIDGYKMDDRGGGSLLLKPYPYQVLDATDDLLNGRSGGDTFAALPVWQNCAQDKHQQAHKQPFDSGGPLSLAIQAKSGGSDIWQTDDRELERWQEGYPMTSSEIDFEPLNDFDINLIRNAILLPASPKYLNERINKLLPLLQQQQQQRLTLRPLAETPTNIRYGKNINLPMFMEKRQHQMSTTSFLDQLRKEDDSDKDDDGNDGNDEGHGTGGSAKGDGTLMDNHKNEVVDVVRDDDDEDNDDIDADDVNDASETKDDEFPPKYNATKSNRKNTDTAPSSSGDGNDSLHFSLKKEFVRNNYNDHNKDKELQYTNIHDSRKRSKQTFRDKKKPISFASTPFLPAVSGGSMTNLGKFFRDLTKNVQFSENHQWTSEEQKLLEGDPNFSNLHHHLSEPHHKSDKTGEWIKAIRFYRPSQKIRSLVAMNPHGQWAHGSQFLDPNYMWVGLGK